MQGKTIRWYNCGPTVYAPSHMGHARNYITFDIIRRILTDYFHYDVNLVMNITDVDDKIINTSNQQGISWSKLSRKFEQEFFDDMQKLGMLPPTKSVRISEEVEEIKRFIQVIIDNHYGYEANGSVYFDVAAFQRDHTYGKLVPTAIGQTELLEEGEGSLTVERARQEKRSPSDFALWKASKPGEPSWDSPWGAGRPGWHIECSAIASKHLGQTFDIHSGGSDLKFPHHDNEIAQSEAHFNSDLWVQFWLHSGHLMIEGRKMSKSLKNFITIRDALQYYPARQLRMLFVLHRFNVPMDYSTNAMDHVRGVDKSLTTFFQNVKAYLDGQMATTTSTAAEEGEESMTEDKLRAAIAETKTKVHDAFCSSFDTPEAMRLLMELIRVTKMYMHHAHRGAALDSVPVQEARDYISEILSVFGLLQLGLADADDVDRDRAVAPVLRALCVLRDQARSLARAGQLADLAALATRTEVPAAGRTEEGAPHALAEQVHAALVAFRERLVQVTAATPKADVFRLADELRDGTLLDMGVRLEDWEGRPTVWKFLSVEELRAERARIAADAEAVAQRKREQERLAAERAAKARQDPTTLFRDQVDKYSAWDDKGIPTVDAKGNPIAKKARKKLEKMWDQQKRRYDAAMRADQQQ